MRNMLLVCGSIELVAIIFIEPCGESNHFFGSDGSIFDNSSSVMISKRRITR